ncbi:hypothetical protein B0H16DRAFT_1484345 [Mycena metata]|uniref:Uncharacterized protein n=1 Tax=Mycena metata TaxID=1033252 RepID=A0AAD7GPY6_9AGAR|nr:hypothetical protein B0H16DRAFT_1484345 [Mycena metata]
MQTHYNTEGARDALDAVIDASKSALAENKDRAIQHLSSVDVDHLSVQVTGERNRIWRLGPSNEQGEVEEEFTFHMQGIVSRLMLIPGDVERLEIHKGINTSQGIVLVGHGSSKFTQSLERLKDLHGLFVRYFPSNNVARWNDNAEDAQPTLRASNRFFTSVEDDPSAEGIAFGKGVDPLNKLAKFLSDTLVHAEANVVKYYKQVKADGQTTFDVTFPSTFRVGDIVEIHASVIAFKTQGRQGAIKMHCNLHGVTLLDNSFSKATEEARRAASIVISVPKNKLRRKNPYAKDEEAGAKKSRQVDEAENVG